MNPGSHRVVRRPPPTARRTFLNDGDHYDAVHAGMPDVPFWVQRARAVGGNVLELACGTGRLSLPMAEAGANVVGIDVSEAFLSRARRKATSRHLDVTFERADMRGFALPQMFQCVALPYRSVAVLLTDQDLRACFACVRRHVERGATFIVDAFNPSLDGTVPSPSTIRYRCPDGGGVVEVAHERQYDASSRTATSVFTFVSASSEGPASAHLTLRLYTVHELLAALRAHSFEVVDHLGGYDGAQYAETSPLQIVVAQAV